MENVGWIFLLFGLIGVVYIICTICYRNKINMYMRSYMLNYRIVKGDSFLRIQLYVGIFNGVIILATALIGYLFTLRYPEEPIYLIMCGCPLIVQIINFLCVKYCIRKGFIN